MVIIKNITRNIKFWAGILFAQFLIFYTLSKSLYGIRLAEFLFDVKKEFHQKLFAKISFSFGDLLYILLVSYLIFNLYHIIFKKTKRKSFILQILITTNVLYLIYQLFWGLLYFQIPIIDKLKKKEFSDKEIETITLRYIKICNTDRTFVSENKEGIFTIKNINEIEKEILTNQNSIPSLFSNKKYTKVNNFKPSLFGKFISYTGILGYYNPFTSEAQYNPYLPSSYLPFTLAHESAHQVGFAKEQEANFIAYIICRSSKNPELNYSASLYVVKSLLNAQLEKNPKFVKKAYSLLSNPVKRDLKKNKEFIKEHESFINDIFYFTNDLFLKSNRQEGIITYSYFLELLLRYEN